MANPQKEDGYTSLSNEIFDKIIGLNISGQELRAALFVVRKTYGFNKKDDYISLSQFQRAMNISKTRASQVVNALRLRKILTVTENINGLTVKYRFNKDYDQWEPLRKNDTVKVLRNPPLRKSVTTKDTLTKEIKKIPDEDFLTTLKTKYTWIDFNREMVKIDAWLLANPQRKKTRRFIVGWLNRIEKPMEIKNGKSW